MKPLDEKTKNNMFNLAMETQKKAYAPYSKFTVGAAILGQDDKIYTGVNVENVSYGLSICAERSGIVSMVSSGCRSFKALVVSTSSGVTPCGACRQVLTEFAESSDIPIYCITEKGDIRFETTMEGLLPHACDIEFNNK